MLAEPCKLSPNAYAGSPALAPPEKPFALFFEFPPAEISFLVVKGVFWWFDYCQSSRGVGASPNRQSRRATRPNPASYVATGKAE